MSATQAAAVACELCKHPTQGVISKSGCRLFVCKACYYPKLYDRCACGRVKTRKSARCSVCRELIWHRDWLARAEDQVQGLKVRIAALEGRPGEVEMRGSRK